MGSIAQQTPQGEAAGPLAGKVFAITGGASGIGLATAQILSRRGATMCIADVDADALAAADKQFSSSGAGARYASARVDISRRAEVDGWVEGIFARFGRLDGAANVAGVIGRVHGKTAVADMDDAEWDRILAVNVTGTMYCMRAQLRRMADRGSIVNVASIHGLKGFAYHAAYDASKHAVIGLTKAAALEVGDREIRINAVAPGAIYTPLMQKNWDLTGRPADAPFDDPTAFKRQGSAEEVGNVMAFLLGPESTFVSGSVYSVDGAWL
ncbi:3-oxoacyl-[acyl-carrier-protein] reductase [Gaeumannomyces tritici R3-111a-1]|uniref:3-oxoacyl-[acyl-carrier-protein] reductase n=1 Tax=Gaeumannomyces tritici (strain R3-111a-1) TaxID=644352 RepID=J3PGG0_GAET3|nr:3-oxoacyl-[acyl-carrier-protein] reductase [Gaeumannomyces tritici R3-111a-1]EJT69702.1 3-oxoacyl-[acyl-carrier-protein] reductase [Gaeumannomyces tritici R3-111a-1]